MDSSQHRCSMANSDICILMIVAVPEQTIQQEIYLLDYYHAESRGGYQILLLPDRRIKLVVHSPTCRAETISHGGFPFNEAVFVEAKFSSNPPSIRIRLNDHVNDKFVDCLPNLSPDINNYDRWLNRSHDGQTGIE